MTSMQHPFGNGPPSGNPVAEPILHVIDFEDVALSPTGVQMLQIGAQAILRQHVPTLDADHLTPQQVMHMFIDQVYWEEHTGGLIMCTAVDQTSFCLPIPKDHWTVRTEGKTFQ